MVGLDTINSIVKHFKIDSECVSFSELQSGHINDTFLIVSASNHKYVLQKTNTNVFENIDAIINNKRQFSEYFNSKQAKLNYNILEYVKTKDDTITYKDQHTDYWNMTHFVEGSKTLELADDCDVVFEAGKLYGDFLFQTSDIDINKFRGTIPDFHSLPLRFSQFEDALKHTENDVKPISELIEMVFDYKKELSVLSKLKAEKTVPLRLTHNDTKLSNILFDQSNKGLVVIDLDTIMPGIVHFDFGDSIRSICSTAKEDESNLDLVKINLEYYEAYCKGYSTFTKDILSSIEIEYLPLSVKTMIYIIGLRFLTDYLNGNIYYKIKYTNHNLIRAKNQFKLLQSVSENFEKIKEITNHCFIR